jgi:hypothetical protein
VKNRFQSVPFTCNLHRYTTEGLTDEGKEAAAKFAAEYKQRNPGMGK